MTSAGSSASSSDAVPQVCTWPRRGNPVAEPSVCPMNSRSRCPCLSLRSPNSRPVRTGGDSGTTAAKPVVVGTSALRWSLQMGPRVCPAVVSLLVPGDAVATLLEAHLSWAPRNAFNKGS